MKIALIQQQSTKNPEENLEKAIELIEKTKDSDIIVLPEAFICPNGVGLDDLKENFNPLKNLSKKAKEISSIIIAGTLPEPSGNKFYNTAYVLDRKGDVISKYRKIHLFDVNLPNLRNCESDRFNPGNNLEVVDTEYGPFGLAVCFDLRFPEMFLDLSDKGAKFIIVPAAFSEITGKTDWELLVRARALDSQCYILACDMAKNEDLKFKTYGHSLIVDPSGTVLASINHSNEEILEFNLDLGNLEEIRAIMPVLQSRNLNKYERN